MNHAPHLYFAWQQLVEKSQLMLRLATEEQWEELIASEMAYVNAVQEIAHLTEEIDPSTTMQEQLRPMLRLILDNESKVKQLLPRFYVSTSKSIIKALINMHSFEIQLSPIG